MLIGEIPMSMDEWVNTRKGRYETMAKTKATVHTVTAPNWWKCACCKVDIPPGTKCGKKGKVVTCYDHIYWLAEKG